MVAGGEALARDADGRVVMIQGAYPGEAGAGRDHDARRSRSRAAGCSRCSSRRRIAPYRRAGTCRAGCGGCEWQHIAPAAQRRLAARHRRRRVERGSARSPTPSAVWAHPLMLADEDFRTTVRVLVRKGRPAFRRAGSHDPVVVDDCAWSRTRCSTRLIANARSTASPRPSSAAGRGRGGATRRSRTRPPGT